MDDLADIGASLEGGEGQTRLLDRAKVWTTIIGIAENEPNVLIPLFNFLDLYTNIDPKFTEETVPILNEKINVFSDSNAELSSRIKASISLFYLLPYIESSNVIKIITTAIEITNQLYNEKKEVPIDFLQPLESIDFGRFQDETFVKLYTFIEQKIKEKNTAALVVLAPMSQMLVQFKDEAISFIEESLMESLSGDDFKKLAGCYLILNLSQFFEVDPAFAQHHGEDLFKKIKALLIDPNPIVRNKSNKAYRELVVTKVFLQEDFLNEIIELYPQIPRSDLVGFFKILSTYIFPDEESEDGEEEEVDLSIIQPILTFAIEKIKGDDTYVKGLCLDTFADLGFRDKAYVEDDVEFAIKETESLVNAKVLDTFEFIGNFLVVIHEQFKGIYDSRISTLLPLISSELDDETIGSLKRRLSLGSNLSVMISKGLCPELTQTVVNFAMKSLESTDEKILFEVCGIFLPLCKILEKDTAVQIFNTLSAHLKTTTNIENVNGWCHVLSKLIKHYNIDTTQSDELINDILEGKLSILHGHKLHQLLEPILSLYHFLSHYIKSNPKKGEKICETLISWLPQTIFQSIPSLLSPISEGIKIGSIISNESITNLLTNLIKLLNKFVEDDIDEIISVLNLLNEVYIKYPKAFNNITEIINNMKRLISMVDSNNEEEDNEEGFDRETIAIMPSITNFVFNVYASDDSVEVNEEVLSKLIEYLPYPPEVEEMNDIMANLLQMLQDEERFEPVLIPALKLITDVLLMKKSELEMYNFDETLDEMKETLKSLVKGNKKRQMEITKDFQKSRAKVNRFNALIR
ncbi:hypothetical protein GPJ56_007915 [Histomonas meleagridis]|uniref:uncharacterized protein n=1 Tax=Histomonas meleagridis TaxID=135588 RepID=UPI0035594058|nr:hypothetical protein GPJ56_007915 [Histomonas meleagridis]KAH0803857.1 hypothetical protein GO595_002687 [Histomonas meleagridis]